MNQHFDSVVHLERDKLESDRLTTVSSAFSKTIRSHGDVRSQYPQPLDSYKYR
jgi:hypothetical protein